MVVTEVKEKNGLYTFNAREKRQFYEVRDVLAPVAIEIYTRRDIPQSMVNKIVELTEEFYQETILSFVNQVVRPALAQMEP